VAPKGSGLEKFVFWRNVAAGVVVAAAIFVLSYANGGFEPTTRAYAAIAAWWLIGVAAALGVGSARARLSRAALAVPVLFALFAVWTLISWAWAPDAGRVLAQFNQVSLYVAALVVGLFLARVVPAAFIAGGVALALSAVAGVALISRLFPSTFGFSPGSQLLQPLAVRLSFPIGYWNGLGIEVALAVPLLLVAMSSQRSRIVRALAVMPFPVIAADMYLASSRGAFVAAGVGALAFLLLAPRRWPALAAAAVGGGAGAAAVAELVHKKALISAQINPTTRVLSHLAVSEGHRAALLIGATCIVAAAIWFGVSELRSRVPAPRPLVGWITAGVLVAVAAAVFVAAHPIRFFDEFRSNQTPKGTGVFVTNHLLSSSGSGRWQFWSAAVSQFRAHPLNGGGAGSWEFWWLQHGSLPLFTQVAHSLYLETMAELGVIGLLLLLGWLGLAMVGAIRSARAHSSAYLAALAATAIAFFASAAYDWVWQLSGIAVVGVGCLGVALGTLPARDAVVARRNPLLRPALALLAVAAIVPQVVVLAAGIHLSKSQSAAAAGNFAHARSEALAAKAVEPWAASPYTQLGRLAQNAGQYDEARGWIGMAIDRSPHDWALWLIASQIDTDRGRIGPALKELKQAEALNPRSNVFKTSP
jgi:O-antigen ligase